MSDHPSNVLIADARFTAPAWRDPGGGAGVLTHASGTAVVTDRLGATPPRPPAPRTEGEELDADERPLPLPLRFAFIVTASLVLWTPIIAAVRALV